MKYTIFIIIAIAAAAAIYYFFMKGTDAGTIPFVDRRTDRADRDSITYA